MKEEGFLVDSGVTGEGWNREKKKKRRKWKRGKASRPLQLSRGSLLLATDVSVSLILIEYS